MIYKKFYGEDNTLESTAETRSYQGESYTNEKKEGEDSVMYFESYSNSQAPHPDTYIGHRYVDLDENKSDIISIESTGEPSDIQVYREIPPQGIKKILDNPDNDFVFNYNIHQLASNSQDYIVYSPDGYEPNEVYIESDSLIVTKYEKLQSNATSLRINKDSQPSQLIVTFKKIQGNPRVDVSRELDDNKSVEQLNPVIVESNINRLFEGKDNLDFTLEEILLLSRNYTSGQLSPQDFAIRLSDFLRTNTLYEFNPKETNYNDLNSTVDQILDQLQYGGIICNQSSILLATILEMHGIETSLMTTIQNIDDNPKEDGNQVMASRLHMVVQIKDRVGNMMTIDPTAYLHNERNQTAKDQAKPSNDYSLDILITLAGAVLTNIAIKKRKKLAQNKQSDKNFEQDNNQNFPRSEQDKSESESVDIGSNFAAVAMYNPKIVNSVTLINAGELNPNTTSNIFNELTKLTQEYNIFGDSKQVANYGRSDFTIPKGSILNDKLMYGEKDGLPVTYSIPAINENDRADLVLAIKKTINYLQENDVQLNKNINTVLSSIKPLNFFNSLLEEIK